MASFTNYPAAEGGLYVQYKPSLIFEPRAPLRLTTSLIEQLKHTIANAVLEAGMVSSAEVDPVASQEDESQNVVPGQFFRGSVEQMEVALRKVDFVTTRCPASGFEGTTRVGFFLVTRHTARGGVQYIPWSLWV